MCSLLLRSCFLCPLSRQSKESMCVPTLHTRTLQILLCVTRLHTAHCSTPESSLMPQQHLLSMVALLRPPPSTEALGPHPPPVWSQGTRSRDPAANPHPWEPASPPGHSALHTSWAFMPADPTHVYKVTYWDLVGISLNLEVQKK